MASGCIAVVTKFCRKCEQEKSATNFFRGRSVCKACDQTRSLRYYHNNKEKVLPQIRARKKDRMIRARRFVEQYLHEHPCVDCGETRLVVLDFDHVRGEKRYNVARLVSDGYALGTIKKEIAKCEVRCSNCHRVRTAKQFGYHGYLAETD